jgi:hypothetical protein
MLRLVPPQAVAQQCREAQRLTDRQPRALGRLQSPPLSLLPVVVT